MAIMTGDSSDAAFQTYAKCRAPMVTSISDSLTLERAAVVPLGFVTACTALFDKQGLALSREGQQEGVIVVWGGSSSVGSFAIQLAANSGLKVYTTASPRNFDYCKALGASEVFDHSKDGVIEDIINAINGERVVGVIDVMSSENTTMKTAETTSRLGGGSLVMTNPPPEKLPFGVKAKCVTAESFPLESKELFGKLWKEHLPVALAKGTLQAKPDPVIVKGGVEKAQDAMNLLKKGVSAQKIVLDVGGSL